MLTRNSVVWVIGIAAGALGFITAHFGLFHLPPAWQPWIELAAVAIGGASAALRQSPLPHSDSSDQSVDFTRLLVNAPNALPELLGIGGATEAPPTISPSTGRPPSASR